VNVGCTATLVVAVGNSGCEPCGALLWIVTSYSPGFCKVLPCGLPTSRREPDEENEPVDDPSSSNFTICVLVLP